MASGESGADSVVIAAVASKDDYVWRVSSDKVPHLTLLYLDNTMKNLDRVTEFVQHAADTSLGRFGMDVDRRGVLGDQEADVLFFGQHGVDRLKDFRRYLLNDPEIWSAYNAVEQYPSWVPHLTLGYPTAPAKPDPRDYPGFTWVNFDRIAVWIGDYEGVEFPLKNQDNALAMSGGSEDSLDGQFLHYGVKGMHWGQRKAAARAARPGGGKGPSGDATRARDLSNQGRNSGRNSLSNKELQDLITRWNLEQQYSKLAPRSPASKAGRWVGKTLLGIGKDEATKYARNELGSVIQQGLKGLA